MAYQLKLENEKRLFHALRLMCEGPSKDLVPMSGDDFLINWWESYIKYGDLVTEKQKDETLQRLEAWMDENPAEPL